LAASSRRTSKKYQYCRFSASAREHFLPPLSLDTTRLV
jgi:hypothetical protein